MGVIIPEGFAQVAWRFTLENDADEMITTCGVENIDSTSAIDVATAAHIAFNEIFDPSDIIEGWTYSGTHARLGPQPGDGPSASLDDELQGTAELEGILNNTALLWRKNTALGGRANRGRFYWPPFNIAELGVSMNGDLAGAQVALLQSDFADALYDNLVAEGFPPMVLHSSAADPTPITQFVVQQKMATQRTRMRR